MEVYPENWTFQQEQDLIETNSEGQEEAPEEEGPQEAPEHNMDPRSHVQEQNGKFVVFDAKGNQVNSFDSKEEAEQYAIRNHEALMND